MAWEVWWALVLGFAISAVVQAWVPHRRIEASLSGAGVGPVARATTLGAASSSCSYAAVAIAKGSSRRGHRRCLPSRSSSPRRISSGSSDWCSGSCSAGSSVSVGFLIAGFVGLLGEDIFDALFIQGAPAFPRTLENVLSGPVVAVLSFVCSIGNVPLAAVLWSGGLSFAGVMAFIFADLIVLPIIAIYRKYYGWAFALRITALMFVRMILAALLVDGLFSLLGLILERRPEPGDVFGSIGLDYKLVLNALALAVFVGLFALTMRRGASDPVCGMTVEKAKALSARHAGETRYFC